MEVVKKIINSGDSVVDIGAHEGFFSLFLAQRVGSAGHIYSFEPNPENLFFLEKNIKINKQKNIKIFTVAVGNKKEQLTFYYSDNLGAWGSLIDYWHDTDKKRKVEVDRLDNLLKERQKPLDFIKIDTEGNEFNVLKGAEKVISQDHPHLCVEVSLSFWSVENESLNNLFDLLKNKGYKLFVLSGDQLVPYFWPADRVFNLFAFHKNKLAKLQKVPNLFAQNKS